MTRPNHVPIRAQDGKKMLLIHPLQVTLHTVQAGRARRLRAVRRAGAYRQVYVPSPQMQAVVPVPRQVVSGAEQAVPVAASAGQVRGPAVVSAGQR